MHGPNISWDIEVGSEITQCERVEVQPIAKRQRQCEDLRLGSVKVGGWVSARVRVSATAVVLWSNDHTMTLTLTPTVPVILTLIRTLSITLI